MTRRRNGRVAPRRTGLAPLGCAGLAAPLNNGRSRVFSTAFLAGLVLLLVGCAAVPEAGERPSGGFDRPASGPPDTIGMPAGFGTLRVEDVSISLAEGPLTIQVTPLDEGILRLLVPESHDRLAAIRSSAGPPAGNTLFLVTFYTETQGLRFSQTELTLAAQGRILRAIRVASVTQGWGTGLLRQREPASAIYSFSEIDLDQEFTVEYRTVRSTAWASILPRLRAERGRVRGRAGG